MEILINSRTRASISGTPFIKKKKPFFTNDVMKQRLFLLKYLLIGPKGP